jgi:hypothetical protein
MAELKTPREKYLEHRIKDAQEELAEARGRRLLRCLECRKVSQFKAWTLSQMMFYVRPHGHSGGDYWKYWEPEKYELTCPKCKKVSQFGEYSVDRETYALVREYRHAFKPGGAVKRGGMD